MIYSLHNDFDENGAVLFGACEIRDTGNDSRPHFVMPPKKSKKKFRQLFQLRISFLLISFRGETLKLIVARNVRGRKIQELCLFFDKLSIVSC